MSFGALAILLGYIVIVGIPAEPQEDEGTPAHLFQLLMGLQVPIIAFFLAKWLPKFPKQTLLVLTLQILSALVLFGLLFFFEGGLT